MYLNPMIVLMRVLFPEPLGPNRMWVSPSLIVRLIPFKTSLPAIVTCKFSTSKIGSRNKKSPRGRTSHIAYLSENQIENQIENKNERSRKLGTK